MRMIAHLHNIALAAALCLVPIVAQAQELPFWRRPIALLVLMAFAMPVAFATWSALLNNFVIINNTMGILFLNYQSEVFKIF